MNTERSHPPALAVWFLRRLCPKRNREAITGDLFERFREGAPTAGSGVKFWLQSWLALQAN